MLPALAFCTLLILLLTVLPVWRNPHWVIRGLDFPRMQIAVLASALLVAQLVFLDAQTTLVQVLLATAIACLLWQAWWILPYTRLWPREVGACRDDNADNQLCILTSNVLTPNRDAEKLIQLVKEHQPDVLVTLESDQWWEDQLSQLETGMPYTVKCPLDNLYGMHVFSRLPLSNPEISYLVEDDVPSIHASIELPGGDRVRAHFLHPAPPSPTENTESAERDAELVIVARSVADSDQPVIVTGDLNDVAWSATTRLFRKISGLLDPRVGRGMFNTFHVDYPLLRWPLDHLFHSDHFTVLAVQRLSSIGSDHFPLLTRLCLTPQHQARQDGLNASSHDQQQAKKIAGEENASKGDVPDPAD